jgi:hypothetical protein
MILPAFGVPTAGTLNVISRLATIKPWPLQESRMVGRAEISSTKRFAALPDFAMRETVTHDK